MSAIADKIRKLIAKADSSTHSEEADAFMTKAQALMMQHGLSLLDLGKLDSEDPLGLDREAASFSASYKWAREIAVQLARYYGCKGVWWKMPNNKLRFGVAGRESARITFTLMFPFVMRQAQNEARKLFNQGGYNSRMQAVTFVGNALALRINRLVTEQRAQPVEARGMNALVCIDQLDALMEEELGKLKVAKSKPLKLDQAAIEAAARVSLYQQTGAAKGTLRIGQ